MGSRHFYKRGWHHTKTRGHEHAISCGFCGRIVPKYKTFTIVKGFGITDPELKRELGIRRSPMLQMNKVRACPGCARFHGIVRKKR